jgi:hypothetical protein
MMPEDSVDARLDQLASVGWTDGWSSDAMIGLRKQLVFWQDHDARLRYLALASGSYDAECIADAESYSELLKTYADASSGAFQPTDVESELVNGEEAIRLAFTLRGQRFETTLPFEGWDYVDEGLEPFLNESLRAVGEHRAFFSLPAADQCVHFACVLPEAYRKAEQAGLFPSSPSDPPSVPEDPKAREINMRLFEAMRSGNREELIESMRAQHVWMLGRANERTLQEAADKILREREEKARQRGGV